MKSRGENWDDPVTGGPVADGPVADGPVAGGWLASGEDDRRLAGGRVSEGLDETTGWVGGVCVFPMGAEAVRRPPVWVDVLIVGISGSVPEVVGLKIPVVGISAPTGVAVLNSPVGVVVRLSSPPVGTLVDFVKLLKSK